MLSAQMINGLILTCIVLMCIVLIIVKYRGDLHSRHSTLRVEKKNEDAAFETLIEYIKNALHELSHSQMPDCMKRNIDGVSIKGRNYAGR